MMTLLVDVSCKTNKYCHFNFISFYLHFRFSTSSQLWLQDLSVGIRDGCRRQPINLHLKATCILRRRKTASRLPAG